MEGFGARTSMWTMNRDCADAGTCDWDEIFVALAAIGLKAAWR